MRIAIIGGGAAGFFAAINLKEQNPHCEVTIYESASYALNKVRVSGGGRCNLTNSFAFTSSLAKVYPRGEKIIRNGFKTFNYNDTYAWFEEHGIKLTTENDGCVFPQSQSSQEIIDMFLYQTKLLGIKLLTRSKVVDIVKKEELFTVHCEEESKGGTYNIVIATTGGSPKKEGMALYCNLPVEITDLMPSLFSFNIKNNDITNLMGAVVENAKVSLQGTKHCGEGALLITHWGVSGPAVLKLSSYAAKQLKEKQYQANILISWVGDTKQEQVLVDLKQLINDNPKKLVSNVTLYGLSNRVWTHILSQAGISPERHLAELGSKGINRLVATLTGDEYTTTGRSRTKDEFVTSGGIALSSVKPSTLESKQCPKLYFAGEVLDIDAITGGYNLQAAWTTAYIVAQAVNNKEY